MAQGQSVTKCAGAIGTSRRRYLALGAGKTIIDVAELEVLVALLGIPVLVLVGEVKGRVL